MDRAIIFRVGLDMLRAGSGRAHQIFRRAERAEKYAFLGRFGPDIVFILSVCSTNVTSGNYGNLGLRGDETIDFDLENLTNSMRASYSLQIVLGIPV